MVQCSDGSYAAADGHNLQPVSENTMNAPAVQHVLRLLTKDSRWEDLSFHGHDNFDALASNFLERQGPRPAFRSGLTEAMKQMVASGQRHHSVDIIDLL